MTYPIFKVHIPVLHRTLSAAIAYKQVICTAKNVILDPVCHLSECILRTVYTSFSIPEIDIFWNCEKQVCIILSFKTNFSSLSTVLVYMVPFSETNRLHFKGLYPFWISCSIALSLIAAVAWVSLSRMKKHLYIVAQVVKNFPRVQEITGSSPGSTTIAFAYRAWWSGFLICCQVLFEP